MKNIKDYIGYITTLIMICVWIVTIMWYGKKIDDNTKQLEKINDALQEQINFNGRVEMYIELDSR